MATKADFNAEEWSTISEAPLLAGMRVVMAGAGGTIRESLAIGKVYGQARQEQGKSELLDELVSAAPSLDAERVRSAGDVKAMALERLREAVGLVEQKASSEEADSYKAFVRKVAETAAAAHKEGGFLGVGGKPVSEDEQKALDEIESALA